MKTLLSLLLLLCCLPCHAEVPIRTRHHVPNGVKTDDGGYCQWASWQTLGNCLHIPELANLKLRRAKEVYYGSDGKKISSGPAYAEAVHEYLNTLGIKVELHAGPPSLSFLQEVCDRGVGAVTSLVNYPAQDDAHAVLVVSVTREKISGTNSISGKAFHDYAIRFYDSNKPCQIQTASYTWFSFYWSGKATYLPGKVVETLAQER
jgi:hypothetical protein